MVEKVQSNCKEPVEELESGVVEFPKADDLDAVARYFRYVAEYNGRKHAGYRGWIEAADALEKEKA